MQLNSEVSNRFIYDINKIVLKQKGVIRKPEEDIINCFGDCSIEFLTDKDENKKFYTCLMNLLTNHHQK
jgi:hypothetical protein